MNWLQRKLFKLKTGADIEVFNDGEPCEEYVIRFKDIYISVLEGNNTYSVSWSENTNFFDIPVREYWTAKSPQDTNDNRPES